MTAPRAAQDLLAVLEETVARIFTDLDELAEEFRALVEGRAGAPAREDLTALRPRIFTVLAEHRPLVAGSGVITAPGLLTDSGYWLEWWWTRTSGAPEALRVNLDPAAPDFFDYTSTDWYSTPQRTGARHVAGPYVDYTCTNEYAITLVVPVRLGERLVGVAAADVPVARLERQVLPALHALPQPTALVNAAGRVVTSSSPRWAPGLLVPDGAGAAPTAGPALAAGSGDEVLATAGWRLVTVPDRADGDLRTPLAR